MYDMGFALNGAGFEACFGSGLLGTRMMTSDSKTHLECRRCAFLSWVIICN